MREIGRVKQGFFPTQDRIVRAVSGLFRLPSQCNGTINVLDAGCGNGQAIYDLRQHWFETRPDLRVSLHGIESDKTRCQQAAQLLANGPGGGSALWATIEDTYLDGNTSLLWFNPPYDRCRGVGRTELTLFNKVKDWPAKSGGLLLLIVPDHILADADVGLATAVEREYELLGLWRYPEPEYSEFRQCVLIARRREKALKNVRLLSPRWASNPSSWPVLPDNPPPVAELRPMRGTLTLRRSRLSNEVIHDAISRSPLRGGMLREATAAAPPIGRPLLPLKHGHLALALAGGLCDGIVEKDGVRFLIKGTLSSAIRKTGTKDSIGPDGEKVAEIDTYRTRYEMNVRCLLEDGTIEDYTSAEPAEEMPADTEEVEDQ